MVHIWLFQFLPLFVLVSLFCILFLLLSRISVMQDPNWQLVNIRRVHCCASLDGNRCLHPAQVAVPEGGEGGRDLAALGLSPALGRGVLVPLMRRYVKGQHALQTRSVKVLHVYVVGHQQEEGFARVCAKAQQLLHVFCRVGRIRHQHVVDRPSILRLNRTKVFQSVVHVQKAQFL